MQEISDEQLALAARTDQSALEILVSRYVQTVYRFCYGYLHDRAEADDATQEVFVKVWRNLGKFDTARLFKPWLFKVARNTCLDSLRKKRDLTFSDMESGSGEESFAENVADVQPLPEVSAENSLFAQKLGSAVGKLSPKYAQVVVLRHEQGLSFREIALTTRKPVNTVKSLYHRALSRLQASFIQKQ